MKKLWKILQSRISKVENSKSEIPFIHESIDFDSFPKEEFQGWINGSHHSLIKQRLRQAYFNHSTGGHTLDSAFEIFDTPMSKGFAQFHKPTYTLSIQDYRFWQHNISEILREEKYILNLADVRSHQKANWIELIYRYYLKPSAKLRQAPKAEQLYGNISIELILRDDKPYMFRLLANSYSDQNFHKPIEFYELINKIVK